MVHNKLMTYIKKKRVFKENMLQLIVTDNNEY